MEDEKIIYKCCKKTSIISLTIDCGVQSSEWEVCKIHRADPLFQKNVKMIREIKK